MQQSKENRSWRLHAPLFYLVAALLFFAPDLLPPEGWALGSHDMRGLFYPWLEHLRLSVTGGQMPFWDTSHFAGYPFLSNPQVAVYYPPAWLAVILPTRVGISLYYLVHFWLAGWGMYRLAIDWTGLWEDGSRPKTSFHIPALAAGLTFMFTGFFTARLLAGHMGLIGVHVWLPWLVWATGRAIRKGWWADGITAGFFLGMSILAGHTTSLLFVGLIWAAFALYWLLADGITFASWLRQMILVGVTGLLLAGAQLVPLIEISTLSARTAETTFEFATDFSFPPTHLITLLVPEFFGEPTRAGYWSVPNFEELTAYFGLVGLLGAAAALTQPRRSTWFLILISIVGLLLAFGRYGFFYQLVYDWLPPFRLARAPGRAMIIVVFAGTLLMAEGIQRLPGISWRWRWVGGAIAAGGIVAVAAAGAIFSAQHPSATSGRLWHQLGGWAWATGLLLSSVLIFHRLRGTHHSLRSVWGFVLLGLIVVDLWTFGYKLRRVEPMTPAGFWFEAADLLGEPFDGRVLPWGISIFEQNGAGQVGLDSLFGYNALEIGPYTALVSSVPDPRSSAYDILGATHVIATTPLEQFTDGERPLTLTGQTGQAWVYGRSRTAPIVRFVPRIEATDSAAEAINRLHQPDFDPLTTATVHEPVSCLNGDPNAAAAVIEERPGYWKINTTAGGETLLVIAETDFPGWRVEIDGIPQAGAVVYGALRGVCVPGGDHTVEWRFVPVSHIFGGVLSGVGLLIFLVAGLFGWTARRRPISPDQAPGSIPL